MRFTRRTFATAATMLPFFAPSSTFAQEATPNATPLDDANASFADRLQFVPLGILEAGMDIGWVDVDMQAATASDDEDPVRTLERGLYVGEPNYFKYLSMSEELIGFSLDAIRNIVSFRIAPAWGSIMQMNMDVQELEATWKNNGYEQKETEHGVLWTIGEGGEIAVDHPVQRMFMSEFNNIAILADDTVAYTSFAKALETIMATAAGEMPTIQDSLANTNGVMPESTLSLALYDGSVLATDDSLVDAAISGDISESNEEVGPMPQPIVLNTGVTAGASTNFDAHDPESEEYLLLEFASSDDVRQAIDVITWRYENLADNESGESFADFLPNLNVEEAAESIVALTRTLDTPNNMFASMIQKRDIRLFGY